jgi:hypothetical protein
MIIQRIILLEMGIWIDVETMEKDEKIVIVSRRILIEKNKKNRKSDFCINSMFVS